MDRLSFLPAAAPSTTEVIESVRDARFSRGISCPRCGTRGVQRWGSFSGRRRYRCLGCRRTFSDLTGTPAAYLKKVELLPAYARCLEKTLSVRKAADTVGVHPSTAFRWRHRLLGTLGRTHQERLSGWIEVGSEWFPYSRKGQRFTKPPPRRRGPRYRVDWQGRRATVVLACDRLGHVASALVDDNGRETESAIDFERLLASRVDGEPVLTSRVGPFGPSGSAARRMGWRFEWACDQVPGPRPWPAHARTVRAHALALRRWLRRFRGVATRYLPNYLSWYVHFDARERRGLGATVLRWPLASGFG